MGQRLLTSHLLRAGSKRRFRFNPTAVEFGREIFVLLRTEDHVHSDRWDQSTLAYWFVVLDQELRTIDEGQMQLSIGERERWEIARATSSAAEPCVEDIRIIDRTLRAGSGGRTVLASASCLLELSSPNRFSVGLLRIHIDRRRIELLRLLDKPDAMLVEKNWSIFRSASGLRVIYRFVPWECYALRSGRLILSSLGVLEVPPSLFPAEECYFGGMPFALSCHPVRLEDGSLLFAVHGRRRGSTTPARGKRRGYHHNMVRLDCKSGAVTMSCLPDIDRGAYLTSMLLRGEEVLLFWGQDDTAPFVGRASLRDLFETRPWYDIGTVNVETL
jgi:hypothetical protein